MLYSGLGRQRGSTDEIFVRADEIPEIHTYIHPTPLAGFMRIRTI